MTAVRTHSPGSLSTIGATALTIIVSLALLVPVTAAPTPTAKVYALESAAGLRLENVTAEPAVLQGKKGVRVTVSDEAVRKLRGMTPDQQADVQQLALLDGVAFHDGVIEVELAGAPAPDAPEGARGFVGIAFRVQSDVRIYDAFYLRPTNGRAEDQERRNHAAQYISHPDWPWFRLRKETPSKYEAYVDLMPAEWTKIKIDVRGDHARLYVHDREQPTLVVNDVKSGAAATGAVALWLDRGTIAHFRNLSVESAPAK